MQNEFVSFVPEVREPRGDPWADGSEIAPDEPATERESFGDALLMERLRNALVRIDQRVSAEALGDVLRWMFPSVCKETNRQRAAQRTQQVKQWEHFFRTQNSTVFFG